MNKNEELSTATSILIQNILVSLTQLEEKRKVKKRINEHHGFSKFKASREVKAI